MGEDDRIDRSVRAGGAHGSRSICKEPVLPELLSSVNRDAFQAAEEAFCGRRGGKELTVRAGSITRALTGTSSPKICDICMEQKDHKLGEHRVCTILVARPL